MQSAALLREAAPETMLFRTPMHDPVYYEVRCEAPPRLNDTEVADWSFRNLHEEPFRKRLGHYFAIHNLRTVYAPTVSHFSGAVIDQSRFEHVIPLSCGVTLKRPLVACDGNPIEHLAALSMAAGGCATIVLSFRNDRGEPICIAAHAGTKSLLDVRLIFEGVKTRAYFSVVDALVAVGKKRGGDPSKMVLRSFFSIPWEAYPFATSDPKHGKSNIALLSYLRETYGHGTGMVRIAEDGREHLCLNALIATQARRAGVGRIETDGYSLPFDGPFAYTTHTDSSLANTVRNLVTVIHQ